MTDSTRGSFIDQKLDSYRNRLSNVQQTEALNWAKKIAQSNQPIEALKQAVAEIGTPLALDFLREGIMHFAGVASAHIGDKLKGLDPRFQEIFKDRMGDLVKLQKMSPTERKKWIANEVKTRKDARIAALKDKVDSVRNEAGDPLTRAADAAKKAARGGADREQDGSGGGQQQAAPANAGEEGSTDEANSRSAAGGDDRAEATRVGTDQPEGGTNDLGSPSSGKPDLSAVDDGGVNERISAFPATDDPEGEFRAISKTINKKAVSGLNKEDRSALRKSANKMGGDNEAAANGEDAMRSKLEAKNKVINDAVGRKQQNLLPADKYSAKGVPTEASEDSVAQRTSDLQASQENSAERQGQAAGGKPEANLTEATEVDPFTGEPVSTSKKAKAATDDDEFNAESDNPYPETQRTVALPPPQVPSWQKALDFPAMGQGDEPIGARFGKNPYSFTQASEAASSANLSRIFPNAGNAAQSFQADGSDRPAGRAQVQPSAALASAQQTAAENLPKIDVRAQASALNDRLSIVQSEPQITSGNKIPVLRATVEAPQAIKATVASTLPKVNATSEEVTSRARSLAPSLVEGEGALSRIGGSLGVLQQASSIAGIAAGGGTGSAKAKAIGEATGVQVGSEASARLATVVSGSEGLGEAASLVPGAAQLLLGEGSAKQKLTGLASQLGQVGGQKLASTGASALANAAKPAVPAVEGAEGSAKPVVSGLAKAVEGGEEGLDGLAEGLAVTGGETGGLGFLAAGVVGLAATLGSIFAPHHDPVAPVMPTPNLSIPVLQTGV